MKEIRIHQVDAFTTSLFHGNPGAVVFNSQSLTDREMRNIAQEMNTSGTGFVLPSQNADFRLRYFLASSDELNFCGHVTIVTLAMIAKEKKFGIDKGSVKVYNIEVNTGLVKGEVDWRGEDPVFSFYALPIKLDSVSFNHQQIARALGISLDCIDQSKPILMERTNQYLYFTINSLEELKNLKIFQDTVSAFAVQHKIVLFCALTPYGIDQNSHAHSRVFTSSNATEIPVTGSAQGPLTAYLLQNSMLPDAIDCVNTEQGDFIGRAGRASTTILNRNPIEVKVSGLAMHVFSADMKLP